nr:TPA_asm: m12 iORF 1 RNA 1 [Murid betaherpesvirus 1]DBA07718.1 TPA_asm: m12 iORF 1 RNA 1 [Murid betaherpesvirus 1]
MAFIIRLVDPFRYW